MYSIVVRNGPRVGIRKGQSEAVLPKRVKPMGRNRRANPAVTEAIPRAHPFKTVPMRRPTAEKAKRYSMVITAPLKTSPDDAFVHTIREPAKSAAIDRIRTAPRCSMSSLFLFTGLESVSTSLGICDEREVDNRAKSMVMVKKYPRTLFSVELPVPRKATPNSRAPMTMKAALFDAANLLS